MLLRLLRSENNTALVTSGARCKTRDLPAADLVGRRAERLGVQAGPSDPTYPQPANSSASFFARLSRSESSFDSTVLTHST